MLSWTKIAGLFRHLLTFGGGFLVASGTFDQATLDTAIPAIMTLIGIVWSMFAPEKKTA